MFKIAVYIVATLALAQQSNGLSKCYVGKQNSKGESTLTETACSTDCVKQHTEFSVDGKDSWTDKMSCAPSATSCGITKDDCSDPEASPLGGTITACCCSTDLCNGVGMSGLSGAIAMALVAAIFWGQN